VICLYKIAQSIYLNGFTFLSGFGTISKCYSVGRIISHIGLSGDIFIKGFCQSWEKVYDCFWDTDRSGIEDKDELDDIIGKNTTEMMMKETFINAGWDFDETWEIQAGFSYPYFKGQYHDPIIISVVPDAYEDDAYQFNMESIISDIPGYNNSLEYWLKTNAGWLSIDDNGVLSGLPTNEDVGSYYAKITVVDKANNLDWKNFTFEVINTNDDPIIITESLSDALEDQKYSFQLDGTDIDPTEDVLSWELLQTNATFLEFNNSTGILSGTPVDTDVGSYFVEIMLSDGIGGFDSIEYELVVQDFNDPPIIISDDVVTALQNQSYNVSYKVYDEDDSDGFKWYLNTDASWLRIIEETGTLIGFPGNDDIGNYFVNISVEDKRGGNTSRNFTLEVLDVNDPPIWETVPIDSRILPDQLFTFELEANDIDDPEIFKWKLHTDADWLTLISGTGRLSGVPASDDYGLYFVNITVEDQRGGSSSYNFSITVENLNDPPIWSYVPDDDMLYEGEKFSFNVDAVDVDGDELSFYVTTDPVTDMSIDKETGVINWEATLDFFTPPYNVLYITVEATDGTEVIYHNFTLSVIGNGTSNSGIVKIEPENEEDSSTTMTMVLMIVMLILLIILGTLLTILVKKRSDMAVKEALHRQEVPMTRALPSADKIFISYAQNDKSIADKICEDLEINGYGCWIAPRNIIPGETWGKAIIKGINDCKVMVMVFSEHSNQSVQVLREIERAVHKKIPIILFRVSEVEPSEDFEYYVSAVHWLDAVEKPIDQHISKLRENIKMSFDGKEKESEIEINGN
jgi:hypothetical protein